MFRVRLYVILYVLTTLLSACGGQGASSKAERIVVIGDIHADIGAAREAFRLAGGTDGNDNWIGEDLVIVQLGDFIGRSYEDREVLDFILAVQDSATAAGGKVHVLIGNHEVFGARLELRWVPQEAYAAFDSIPGQNLDDPRLAHIPAEQRARSAALMPGGYYAKRISEFPAVLRLGKTIFVHAGVTPHWAEYGVDRINEEISQWFAGQTEQPVSARGMDHRNLDDSVVMSRHFSEDVGAEECAMLEESLQILGAERMIVAHTVKESISARCDEKVWLVDIGMSRYYGGKLQVLELINDEVTSVIEP